MANYLTSANPTVEDWLEYNAPVFDRLRKGDKSASGNFAVLTDVDNHAEAREMKVEEFFDALQQQVGDLGPAELKLVHNEMDDAWHVILAAKA